MKGKFKSKRITLLHEVFFLSMNGCVYNSWRIESDGHPKVIPPTCTCTIIDAPMEKRDTFRWERVHFNGALSPMCSFHMEFGMTFDLSIYVYMLHSLYGVHQCRQWNDIKCNQHVTLNYIPMQMPMAVVWRQEWYSQEANKKLVKKWKWKYVFF